jgi:hypothetical protein
VDATCVALQKHFGYARRTAEVTVNLERRMHVPKVVRRTVFEQVAIERV